MFRREEMIEHGGRAECLDERAFNQAERGHYGRAEMLDDRSDVQRAEMIGAAVGPYPRYGPPVGGAGVVAAETAGAVTGAVVAGEVAAHHRQREIREAEFEYGATRPVYPGNVYVEPAGVYPPAGYGGAYRPVGEVVYQPGAAYPPTYPPGAGYPPAYPPY